MDRILETIGVLMFLIGASSMDSASLLIPAVLVVAGLGLLLFAAWAWNYRI